MKGWVQKMTDEDYKQLIVPYDDARQMMLTRLDVLNHTLYRNTSSYPIHYIQSRIKARQSMEDKLVKKEKETSTENAKNFLQDIAGIRIICYFVDDIYNLVKKIKCQSDLVFIRESDYIAHPKENGYRSYHIIVGVPVYCLDGMEYFPVEIQFRTISMDFWASMEHRMVYKKKCKNKEELREELKTYADMLVEIEQKFEKHNEVGRLENDVN